MDPASLARRYYDALDDHEYDAFEEVLAADFVQRRPDRTFEDRESFVQFMREDRPNPDTSHELEAVISDGERAAAHGRVLDGERVLFEFADFFECADGQIVRLETYSR
ncbi:nuclear transport factor 2 family protein [Natronorubrum tibetense]|uniref:SnoaL-like domain-containing protein n=1 Tax=Natronorubrum tibetense GA33 TaxID=1114856 RepID=L9VVS1_9EURY|nr:nuclear transport factor 2 family protein [Natronorubrum tibetense]ELY41111.1 hypothetical protein C496_10476 [Natronorubrum tibetense GA33]